MNKVIVGVVIVAIVAVSGVLLLTSGSKNKTQQSAQTQITQTQQTTNTPSTNPARAKQELIDVTATGFSPASVTIKAGTRVIWVNKGTTPVTVNSADHPTHLKYSPLNLGEFGSNQSVQLVFDKTGTYNYHNHLNPSQTGTIVVQ